MDDGYPDLLAAHLRVLAGEARQEAVRAAAVDPVTWRSLAAERFRALLRREAACGHRCADLLEDAAEAFAAHARAVGGASRAAGGVG